MNALLPAVLMRGTKKLPDLRAVTEYLDDCYGGSMGALVRRCGDVQTVGFYLSFPADRYAPEGEPILARMVELLRQTLLEPAFTEEFVQSEKKNLISTIESERNDKRAYAAAQLIRAMCREDSFGVPRLGDAPSVEAITAEQLRRHYAEILNTSPVEIFYIGSASPEELKDLLAPLADALGRAPMVLTQTPFRETEPSTLVEEQPVQQSKLCMGFTTGIRYGHRLLPALMVLNQLYGGGMTGKLFTHVRERLGLCYYAGSGCYGTKGILTVSAGIDAAAYDTAKAEILAQLEACARGEFTDRELADAKTAILSTLETTPDSPSGMEGFYATGAITGFGMELAEYAEAIAAVTAEQVTEAAQCCRLNTVFFLKGTA